MERRQLLTWAGAALAAALLAMAFRQSGEKHAPVKLAAEPQMFSFVKPMDDIPDAPPARKFQPPAQPAAAPAPAPAAMLPGTIAGVELEAQRLRALGASDDEIYRLRATGLSAEAAARLADMEREETIWQVRISAYLAERSRLLAAAGEYGDVREALQQLRQTHFSADEQARLANFEPPGVPQLTMD